MRSNLACILLDIIPQLSDILLITLKFFVSLCLSWTVSIVVFKCDDFFFCSVESAIVVHSLSCPTLRDPVNCSTPGFPVLHCLPEFAQTHVH